MKQKGLPRSNRGFTLIELILYIGIVTIILTAIVPFTWATIGNTTKSSTQQEIYDSSRFLSEKLKYEIRNAKSIVSVTPTTLTLLEFDNSNTVINYANNTLTIQRGSSPSTLLHPTTVKITSFVFQNLSSANNKSQHVQFNFTLTANYQSQSFEYQGTLNMEGSAELRSN